MKFLTVQLPPFSRHLIPLRSKYSYQNPVLKHYALPLASETKFHTHTKQLVELAYGFVYFNFYISGQQAG
jgi:hypothetical protein